MRVWGFGVNLKLGLRVAILELIKKMLEQYGQQRIRTSMLRCANVAGICASKVVVSIQRPEIFAPFPIAPVLYHNSSPAWHVLAALHP